MWDACPVVSAKDAGSIPDQGPYRRQPINVSLSVFNFKGFIYLFLERREGKEREREREKHQCVVASHMPPTRDMVTQTCALTGN